MEPFENHMENLTDKVTRRLEELGKSKTDLAKYTGVSWNGLAKMIKRGTFKSDYMLKIQKFLEVDINFFGLNSKQDSENITAHNPSTESADEVIKVKYLERIIQVQDEVIKSKDELIETLKSKLKQ